MVYIDQFLRYLQYVRHYSVHTVNAYRVDLMQFAGHYEINTSNADIVDATYKDVRAWIVNLVENKISSRSVNRKISSLKSFYKYLLREGVIKQSPLERVISLKTSKNLPVFLKEDQMVKLFDDVDFGEGYEACRDKIIMELFYNTGMRVSELINVKHRDIDFDNKTIRVLGKRNKERIVPITNQFAVNLKEFMDKEDSVSVENIDKGYLFYTKKGGPLYHKLVYRIVNKYITMVATLKKRSPHVIRHTFATHMLNKGADLNAIKEILGHANLSATEVYTHNSFEKLKSIYKQAHPRA